MQDIEGAKSSMMDYIALVSPLLAFAIPLIYAKAKRVNNIYLFYASVLGFSTLIQLLLAIVLLPVIVLSIFVIPQLEAFELSLAIFSAIEWGYIHVEWLIIFIIPLNYYLSRATHRRYALFEQSDVLK